MVRKANRQLGLLRERLAVTDDPRGLGASLRSPAKSPMATPLWRYRAGDWRIAVRIEDEVLHVLVLRVAHRREVYRRATRSGPSSSFRNHVLSDASTPEERHDVE